MTIDDVFTTAEASLLWGIAPDTLKKACRGQKGNPPRFTPEECRKSCGTWIITRSGMERLYGEMKKGGAENVE